ncbi:protein NUCLEAR FUSION DEFECTIVE 4 isoform X1 [Rosa rugosa]|uniref:protein NUCLEAR FUSION DEFECTIVE 4 isoform X1 n=1 Tax=Rosa rugosa TaxID=74645 RepID=UPI002B418441|nr:protein NUCLEAR FUSION DEFECTIVE 4 isoform X1 [Rosa rugosa]
MPSPVLKAGSRPPWVGLGAAVWVQIAAGNAYNFPLYSPLLKSVLGYNQMQLTILGVASDIGESVALLPGIACNKFPPWAVLLVGCVLCFFGYGVLWLAVSETVANMPYILQLFITILIAMNSNAWFGTAVLVTNMRNFPLSRGTVAGILKGYIGISAAVYTVVYSLVLKESALNLLLFLALGLPVLCLALMYFIRPCTPASGEESSEHGHFLFTQVVSVVLAVYLLLITVVNQMISLSQAVSYILIAIVVILLLSPLAIPVKMTLFPVRARIDSSDQLAPPEGNATQTDPLLTPSSSATNLGSFHEADDSSDVETLLAIGEGAVTKKKRRPKRGEDFKFQEAFIKADFWLLWFVYFLGVGSGVTVLNNLSQIGVALGSDETTILLSLFSFCNFVGRLGSGVVSEHFVKNNTLPRTFWMTCAHILMILSFILYALDLSGSLYAATTLLGICYGVQYSMMVPTVSELFGLKHFGINYGFMLIGNPIGAVLFSVLLAGNLYDAEAAKQGTSTCIGADCFRITFIVLAGVCGLGTILSIILTVRVRPVYQMLYAGGSFRLPASAIH